MVARGEEATYGDAHSVHAEPQGLEAGYAVLLPLQGQRRDQPGRPHEDGAGGPSALAFAFASCQQYEHGYYTAYKHMAQEDLDLVIHLGDYIYEYDSTCTGRPAATSARNSNHEIVNLADYRERHAQYKTDPDLQAAHAAFPWLVTFDDHEIDNNWADDIPEEGLPLDVFARRRRAAFQAYWEHMPLRKAHEARRQRRSSQPGVAREYTATATANVTSSAGNAALIVQDPSPLYTNHLVNGSSALAQPLQAKAANGTYGSLPTGVKFWGGRRASRC